MGCFTHVNFTYRDNGKKYWKEIPYSRKLSRPQEGVVKVVKVTIASHGFDGYLGLCVGHTALLDTTVIAPKVDETTLIDFLRKQKEEGNGDKSLDDILAVWDGSQKREGPSTVLTEQNSPPKATPEESVMVTPPSEKAIVSVPDARTTGSPNPISISVPMARSTGLPSPTSPSVETPIAKKTAPKKKPARRSKPAAPPQPAPRPRSAATPPPIPAKRKAANFSPGEKSPIPMKNGNYSYGCAHQDPESFIEYERLHFNSKLCAQDNYPSVCTKCTRSLLPGGTPKTHCVIKGIESVHCCRNSINHRDHDCVYALCHACWVQCTPAKRGHKRRRVRVAARRLLPGEQEDSDGSIRAST